MNPGPRRILLLILAMTMCAVMHTTLLADSCVHQCPNTLFQVYDIVFAGFLSDSVGTFTTTRAGHETQWTVLAFTPTTIWKGPVAEVITVAVINYELRLCAFEFGEHYIIYAQSPTDGPLQGKGVTSCMCHLNRLVTLAIADRYTLPTPVFSDENLALPRVGLNDFMEMLTSSDRDVANVAVQDCNCFKNDARELVPMLVKLLREIHNDDSTNAIVCLGRLGPAAAAALPVLEHIYEDGDAVTRETAGNSIQLIKPREEQGKQ